MCILGDTTMIKLFIVACLGLLLLDSKHSSEAVSYSEASAPEAASTPPRSLHEMLDAKPLSFKPKGTYSDEIADEIRTCSAPERIKRISLERKPLAFAGNSSIFDEEEAQKVISAIQEKIQNLEILDLSQGRLPEDALSYFAELLLRPNFRYLDVRLNSGASTLDALGILSSYLGDKLEEHGRKRSETSSYLNKVIWLPEEFLSPKASLPLPPETIEAHKKYFISRMTQ